MAGSMPQQGRQGSFGAALDVWRDGAHLWRSYAPSDAVAVDDWHFQRWHGEFGAMYPRDYDSGIWRAPGVRLTADSLVPTHAATRWIGGVPAVCDLIATALAIGQLPHAPEGLDDAPQPGALYTEMCRDTEDWIVRGVESGGVTVRALIAPCAPPDPEKVEEADPVWYAVLMSRPVRAGSRDATLPEGEATFTAPIDAPPHILARRAKAALGISGHLAQRQGDSLVWHLSCAPYRLEIWR